MASILRNKLAAKRLFCAADEGTNNLGTVSDLAFRLVALSDCLCSLSYGMQKANGIFEWQNFDNISFVFLDVILI